MWMKKTKFFSRFNEGGHNARVYEMAHLRFFDSWELNVGSKATSTMCYATSRSLKKKKGGRKAKLFEAFFRTRVRTGRKTAKLFLPFQKNKIFSFPEKKRSFFTVSFKKLRAEKKTQFFFTLHALKKTTLVAKQPEKNLRFFSNSEVRGVASHRNVFVESSKVRKKASFFLCKLFSSQAFLPFFFLLELHSYILSKDEKVRIRKVTLFKEKSYLYFQRIYWHEIRLWSPLVVALSKDSGQSCGPVQKNYGFSPSSQSIIQM